MEKGGTPVDGKKGTILRAGAAVLLALTIWQGWTLREQGEQIAGLRRSVQDLGREVQSLSGTVQRTVRDALEEADSLLSSYEVKMAGLDAQTRSALAEVTLWPKEYRKGMTAVLLVSDGQTGDTRREPMADNGAHGFACTLSLSLEGEGWWTLNAELSDGGTVAREKMEYSLDAWSVLPHYGGGSWSGKPERVGDAFAPPLDYDVWIEDPDGTRADLTDTEFRMYCNGALAFSTAGVLSETAGSGGEAMWTCRDWQESYPAQEGDTFLLTFRGVDRPTGVGYEFPIEVWYMTEGGGIRQGVPSDVQGGKLMASGLDRPSIEWPDEP